MPRGDKTKYSAKHKRKAQHIEEGYEERGAPPKEAERRAWATVNKMHGGGSKGGSGTEIIKDPSPAKKEEKLGVKNMRNVPLQNFPPQQKKQHKYEKRNEKVNVSLFLQYI